MLYIFLSGLGAGLSASRCAWERVSLHELRKTHNNLINKNEKDLYCSVINKSYTIF